MKWVVLLVLFLAACSGAVETTEPIEETLSVETEVAEPEPAPEPSSEPSPVEESETETPDTVVEEDNEEVLPEETVEEPSLSLAEEYMQTFEEKIELYSATYEHEEYGQVRLSWWPQFTKYYMNEYYFDAEDDSKGWAVKEDYVEENRDELVYKQIEYVEYIWLDGGIYSGCMRDDPKETYLLRNCLNENESYIVHTGLKFDAPRAPHEWLEDFYGEEPVEIRTGRNYKENAADHVVDQVYYDNGDGTETLLYVHKGYKMPLQIEILKDRKVIETIAYENIIFNKKNIWDDGAEI